MKASSRQIWSIAVAGSIVLSGSAFAQPGGPDDGLSKKEMKQMRQQERQGGNPGGPGGGPGGPGGQPGGARQMQQAPRIQGAPQGPSFGGQPSGIPKQNDGPKVNQNQFKANRVPEQIQAPPSHDLGAAKFNQPDARRGGGNKGKNQGNAKQGSGDSPLTAKAPGSVQIQDVDSPSKKELKRQENALEQQNRGNKGNKSVSPADVSPDATPFVPAGAPPTGGRLNEGLSKKEQKQQNKEQKQGPDAAAAVSPNATPFVPAGAPPSGDTLSKKEQKQQNKQDKKAGNDPNAATADATPFVPAGAPPTGDALGKKDQNRLDQQTKKDQQQADKLLKQQDQQAQKDLRQQEQDAKKQQNQQEKLEKKGLATPAAGDPTATNAVNAGMAGADLSKKEIKQQAKDAKQAEQAANQAAKQLAQLEKKQDKIELKNLSGAEKAAFVGADATNLQVNNFKKLSKKDSITVIGDNNTIIKNKYVDKDIIYKNNGYPNNWGHGGWNGNHHDNDDWLYAALLTPLVNYALHCATCLPPVPVVGVGYGNLNWNYWDGRSYYDHGYAYNMFNGVGHYQYNGYDGVVAGGNYYCYGYGWMPGCIDYGDRRIWVPGFWAPYTVEECGNVPIWIPPVYEDVWTGCCWETVQVDGGYFGPSPTECHFVTRYTWVPGHFQNYYI